MSHLSLVPPAPQTTAQNFDDDATVATEWADDQIQEALDHERAMAEELKLARKVAHAASEPGAKLLHLAVRCSPLIAARDLRQMFPDLARLTDPNHPTVATVIVYLEHLGKSFAEMIDALEAGADR